MDNSTVLTQNITITAQYTPKTYTVTIYPNGASGSNKTYSVSYGTSWSIPSCPFSRSGYNFGGYKTSSSSGTSYSAGGEVTVTGDLSLYCQWTAVQYTVSIHPNGASGSTKTYIVTYGQKWTVPNCPFSRTGYTFSGYSGGYSVGQSITITGDISINCNWEKQMTIGVSHTLFLRNPRLGSPSVDYETTGYFPNEDEIHRHGYSMKVHLYIDGELYDEGISSNYWYIGADGTGSGLGFTASRDRKNSTYKTGDFVRVTIYKQGIEQDHIDLSLAGKSAGAGTVTYANYYWA